MSTLGLLPEAFIIYGKTPHKHIEKKYVVQFSFTKWDFCAIPTGYMRKERKYSCPVVHE